MKDNFFTSVNFYKNNQAVSVISVDVKKLFQKLLDEGDKKNFEKMELKFTFGNEKVVLDETNEIVSIFNMMLYESTLVDSRKLKNKNNENIENNKNNKKIKNIISKKKETKLERKKYQERKNKRKTKEEPPKPPIPTIPDNKVVFYYEDQEFVESKSVKMVKKRNNRRVGDIGDVPIEKWTSHQFLEYMSDKFNQTYGFKSMEFGTVGGKSYSKTAKGILYVNIKNKLILTFKEIGLTNQDLKDYIDYLYDVKVADLDFPITLNFIVSKVVLTQWLHISSKIKRKNVVKNNTIVKKIHKPKIK